VPLAASVDRPFRWPTWVVVGVPVATAMALRADAHESHASPQGPGTRGVPDRTSPHDENPDDKEPT
jgi:hypothetical protein